MNRPSIKSDYCVFCGRPKNSEHHVVPRSQGGSKGATLSVCGFGNESGCHGLLHSHNLHVNFDEDLNSWIYLYTPVPTKYEKALQMSGWKLLKPRGRNGEI